MDAGGQFGRKNLIDHAVTFDPALPAEGFRYDMNPEMTFTARPMARMPLVAVRFILDIEALRKARAEDDGYRIGLDEFLAENPAD